MKITIRIYGKTDPDIMGVCLIPKFDFQSEFHRVLCSYVRGTPYKVKYSFKFYNAAAFPTVMQRHIVLDPSDDADVIRWLKRIRPMERNKFIKNLFRNSLAVYPAYNYFRCEKDFSDFLKEVQRNADLEEESDKEDDLKDAMKTFTVQSQNEMSSIPGEIKENIPSSGAKGTDILPAHLDEGLEKHEQIDSHPSSKHAPDVKINKPTTVPELDVEIDEIDDIDDFDDLEQMMDQFNC